MSVMVFNVITLVFQGVKTLAFNFPAATSRPDPVLNIFGVLNNAVSKDIYWRFRVEINSQLLSVKPAITPCKSVRLRIKTSPS